ncbi:uncharacterized protein LOC109079530 isoform X1 [Cyprinus carpio]|uniref:Uncharacterized protein LOC109079530 isoform X1 n=1 Tax=Cyprinus carpio TaxID=7962 RepID=A0A9Q9X3M1_CYPCA|nr:uncharacterized protein LOC109079530 isoform X1 [Cyprinus carpio]
MMLIFGLMLLLLQTAACLDQLCTFDEPYSIKQCYAALGHKLSLQMMLNPSYTDLYLYKTLNDGSRLKVFSIEKNKKYDYESIIFEYLKNVPLIINTHESIRNRSEFFFDNMTLTINNVTKPDSGRYTSFVIEIDMAMESDLQVIVEAPIGSVEVSIICSSNQTTVFCSSEGDLIIYSWTLNGKILQEGFNFLSSSIDLDKGTDGNISCSVKNNISHAQKTITLKPCPVSLVFVLVWCLQLMVLLGLLGPFHIYMRHTSGKKQEDQKVRMRRLREGHEHTAEDS